MREKCSVMPITPERIKKAARRLREEANAASGSVEEYIAKRLEAARAAALQKSRTRTEPAVPMTSDAVTRSDAAMLARSNAVGAMQDLENMTNNYRQGLGYYVMPGTFGREAVYGGTSVPSSMRDNPNVPNGAAYVGANDSDAYNHWRLAMLREASMQNKFADALESDPTMKIPGLSCIYTATDNYGNKYRVVGNQTFLQDPERYGFMQIPFSEAKPGDIVQDAYPEPFHAMILDSVDDNGVHLYNYSSGGTSPDDIKKDALYYPDEDNEARRNAFRFVGTPADSLRWKKEFNGQNGFAHGGNMFVGGGPLTDDDIAEGTDERSQYARQILKFATDNPRQFWADTEDSAKARQWLNENAPAQLSSLYNALDDKSFVDQRFIPNQDKQREFQEGVTGAISDFGKDVYNVVDTATGFMPGPVGTINWLAHTGADLANGNWKNAATSAVMAGVMGGGLKAASKGLGFLAGKSPWLNKTLLRGADFLDDLNWRGGVRDAKSLNGAYGYNPGVTSVTSANVANDVVPAMEFERLVPDVSPESALSVANAAAPYEISDLGGGYMLKSLMRGNPLEKQISKNGTVNVNNVRALVGKGSKVEQAVVDKVLASEEFAGKKAIDYNKFRKAVQDELITYNRTPERGYATYGMGRLGLHVDDSELNARAAFLRDHPELNWQYYVTDDGYQFGVPGERYIADSEVEAMYPGWRKKYEQKSISPETYTFSSSRIPNGSSKHYDANTIGHSRTYTTADEPDVLHVMESQSDWAQRGKEANRRGGINSLSRDEVEGNINSLRRNIARDEAILEEGIGRSGAPLTEAERLGIDQTIGVERQELETFEQWLKDIDAQVSDASQFNQEDYLIDNYTSRQIQENLRYAAEKGQTKMRYPTRETAAKIEGYPGEEMYVDERGIKHSTPYEYDQDIKAKLDAVQQRLDEMMGRSTNEFDVSEYERLSKELSELSDAYHNSSVPIKNAKKVVSYANEHEGILKKYDAFPKQYKKLYRNSDVRTVTDAHGNTWYEVDVPENYLQQEWQFGNGGTLLRKYDGGGYVSDAGEIAPAIVTPSPVQVHLYTDRITKKTPITHSWLEAGPRNGEDPGIYVSKGSADPTYNLLAANCSDATGEILEALSGADFTSGITTPYGVRRKARDVFGDYPYYRETPGVTAHQSFYVPWYDYRVAKDVANARQLESNIATARRNGASEDQINQIVTHWEEEHPKLSYRLDENGSVVPVTGYTDGGTLLREYKGGGGLFQRLRDNIAKAFSRGPIIDDQPSIEGGEIEPAILTASPQTARGQYKLAKQEYKQAKRENDRLQDEILGRLSTGDVIFTDEEAKPYIGSLLEMTDPYNAKEDYDNAKDAYYSQIGGVNSLPAQLYRYYSRHYGHQSKKREDGFRFGKGADVIDLSKNVIRLTPDSKQSTALFNEFVENGYPTVRPASEYKNNPNMILGDKYQFPASGISIYGGIEDGKFRLDSLNNFNNNTTVIPARNIKSGMPLISEIKIIESDPEKSGPNKELLSSMLEDLIVTQPVQALELGENKDEMRAAARTAAELREKEYDEFLSNGYARLPYEEEGFELLRKYADTGELPENDRDRYRIADQIERYAPGVLKYARSWWPSYRSTDKNEFSYYYTDPNGETHPISGYNASILDGKTVLGNPSGGVFVGRMQDISKEQLDALNEYLKENPSWIMRTDLGSFDQYRLDNPSLQGYLKQYYEHPDANDPNVYTVGTTEPNKLFEFSNGGTMLHMYNGGGNTTRKASRYITILPDDDEAKFQEWYQRYALNHNLNPNPDAREHYYDYRGYWDANRVNPDLELSLSGDHFPDTWKTPGHPTFSVDSVYAKYAPEIAGRWENGQYIGPSMFDADTMKLRQRYAESSFRDDLRSPAGAVGRYQIMPATYKEYVDRTGNKGDLLDPKYNEALRDWYLETRLPQFEAMKRGNPNDLIREYRRYAAYNMGPGGLNRALTRAEKAGVDIDNTLDWVKYLPKETREYVDFIVGGRDIQDTSKTTSAYEAALKANGLYANGGNIHIDPSKKGTFRAQATRMGMSVKEAASHILAHKENYSPEMVKKAVFARNFAGDGGLIERYGHDKIREAINKIKRG